VIHEVVMNFRTLSHCGNSLFAFSLIKLTSGFKISYIFGSHAALFSLSNCTLPLAGRYLGITGATMITVLHIIARAFWGGISPYSLLVYHIPGFCAALYWTSPKATIRLLVPILAIIAFISHPVGSQSVIYSLLWLLPIAVYTMRLEHMFAHALASTFVAHAVGSVMWLYLLPTTPLFWNALTPVACIERVTFALGMTVLAYAIDAIRAYSYKPVLASATTQRC